VRRSAPLWIRVAWPSRARRRCCRASLASVLGLTNPKRRGSPHSIRSANAVGVPFAFSRRMNLHSPLSNSKLSLSTSDSSLDASRRSIPVPRTEVVFVRACSMKARFLECGTLGFAKSTSPYYNVIT
jgi:hypothetical protein